MKKHLEFSDAKSNKFWEIELKGKTIKICYGRIGIENPATQNKSFASADLAKKYYEKKLKEKINKGYI
jgi:predicted DNA-binding WGR domain protein